MSKQTKAVAMTRLCSNGMIMRVCSKEGPCNLNHGGNQAMVMRKSTIGVKFQKSPENMKHITQKREKFFDSERKMLVFNRNRVLFEWILFYYQSHGDLYIPKVCVDESLIFLKQ